MTAFVDLTGDSSEDERSAKQPPAAVHCHGVSHSDVRPRKASEGLRPDAIVARGEGGAAEEQAGERVKRRRGRLPARQSPSSPAAKNGAGRLVGRQGVSRELARLPFACPGAKLTSPAPGGKRKRSQLGATACDARASPAPACRVHDARLRVLVSMSQESCSDSVILPVSQPRLPSPAIDMYTFDH